MVRLIGRLQFMGVVLVGCSRKIFIGGVEAVKYLRWTTFLEQRVNGEGG